MIRNIRMRTEAKRWMTSKRRRSGAGRNTTMQEEVGPTPSPTFRLPELRVPPGLCQIHPGEVDRTTWTLIFRSLS